MDSASSKKAQHSQPDLLNDRARSYLPQHCGPPRMVIVRHLSSASALLETDRRLFPVVPVNMRQTFAGLSGGGQGRQLLALCPLLLIATNSIHSDYSH